MATMAGTVKLGRNEEVRALSGRNEVTGLWKSIGLFLAAPFVGLAYIIIVPIVGTAVILRLAVRTLS